MQTAGIRSRFEATGVVRLQGAFAAEQAAAMREAVWRHAEQQAGLRPGDPASWAGSPVVNWQGLKRDPGFRPLVDNQLVSDALDVIFGAGGWQRPRCGAQILFSPDSRATRSSPTCTSSTPARPTPVLFPG